MIIGIDYIDMSLALSKFKLRESLIQNILIRKLLGVVFCEIRINQIQADIEINSILNKKNFLRDAFSQLI